MLAATPRPSRAQDEAELAIRFFLQGGAYCTRVVPEGTNLSEETEWTILMLTSTGNRKNAFRMRSVDPGPLRVQGKALEAIGLTVTGVWRRERVRDEFFDRFARYVEGGQLRARVVKLSPPKLSSMSERERAEAYLDFADSGSRIDFAKARDLTVEQFLAFRTYMPD